MQSLGDSNLLVISHQYNHFVKEQVDELANYYHHITVVVRYNRITSITKYIPSDYLKMYSKSSKINSSDQPDNVTVIPMPITYLPTNFSRRRLGDRHVKRLRRIIETRDISFDILHSHFIWTAGYAGQTISDDFNVPHILTIHENTDTLSEYLESKNEDFIWTLNNADLLVRVSHTDIEKLQDFNSDIVQVPNGYDTERFEPISQDQARQYLGIDPECKLLFSLGSLIERKGFRHVISILPRLNENQNVMYVIGGHGPKKEDYLRQARDLGVQDKLELLDFVPEEEIKYWMNAADLFVHPSHSESFGIVQIEAMACGTPVIAGINGGSEHLITSDEYGILFNNPYDQDELYRALEEGFNRQWEKEPIVNHAQRYTISTVCNRIAELQRELLERSRKSNK